MTCSLWKWMIAAFLFTACALLSVPAVGQARPTQNVLVVNGAGQPVPTAAQGTTNIAGTVGLAAGSNVNVTNPPDSQNNPTPLAVLDATQPYEDACNVLSNGTTVISCPFRVVPSGKRLVIQEVDMTIQANAGLKPLSVGLFVNALLEHQFTATFMGDSSGLDYFAMHQETRLYVGANQTPTCSVFLSGASTAGGIACALSGFLVDVP